MDNYTEQILDCKPSSKGKIFFAIAVAIMMVGVLVACFFNGTAGITVIAVGVILIIFRKSEHSSEYEYLFINGDCDIARISNKETRKNKYSFKDSDVLKVLKYEDEKAQNDIEHNPKVNPKDFTSGECKNISDWYVFFVNVKDGTDAVVMELNEKNVNHCKAVFKDRFQQ